MARKKKSQTFEAFGKFRFYRGFEQNRDMEGPEGANWGDKHDGMCLTDFIVDEENLQKFRASGTRWKIYNRHYENQKGERPYFDVLTDDEHLVKLRRQFKHSIADFSGPPVTELANGEVVDPEDGWGIGNDSYGYVQFTVYDTPLGKGSRWEGSQITKWVKFPLSTGAGAHFKKRDMEEVVEYVEEDDDNQPVMEKKSKPVKQPVVNEDMNDEIPL